MQMFVDESTTMLDPTTGSGNSVIIAERLGAKKVLGIERDKEFHKQAVKNYKENKLI